MDRQRKARQVEALTDSRIRRLGPAKSERVIHDSVVHGLAIRIQPGGAKSWIFRRDLGGATRRITLGRFPGMGTKQARMAAAKGLLEGPESLPDRSRLRAMSPTFRAFAEEFMRRHARNWKASTVRSTHVYLKTQLIPTFGAMRLDAITHADVAEWYYDYGKTRPGGANRAHDIFEGMVNTAIKWGRLPAGWRNPCHGLPAFRRAKIGRMLTRAELARLGAVFASSRYKDHQGAIILHLILLTGCRPGEILGLRWSQWDGARRLSVPTKTGARAVPLGEEAERLLAQVQQRECDPYPGGRSRSGRSNSAPPPVSDFVFPARRNANAHQTALTGVWATIRKRADLRPDLRIYDLRHTYASMAVNNGESVHMTGELLGHRRTSTTQRYAHLDDREIRRANEIIGAAIEKAIEGCRR